ncbi:bifunctional 5,10-methylenetetrahydrofolate dehydrogenase/5,10-methenyltetrahydrofolate cyclohydrolase [Sinosporangium siamense]|uniref:Bifunctional protein FolD n=1 Tax=Sinosporangium siamense TaxID=1367973 RepID=A0A919RCK0_9ACTN|nr:bifunctional 5,10-methylenetetrahydrofolate dehydrogenase/5,10-methenyltetrahydrofolate cyclohydrolase [Sinosporangium siamense]GII89984.1 bifunctional protein FolD [Sinosporangium siamense]
MTATLLSGKELAAAIRAEIAVKAAELSAVGVRPRLAVVYATADESAAWYVRLIAKTAEKVGVGCEIVDLGPDASERDVRYKLSSLSLDQRVHGIILQTPLPHGVRMQDVALAIAFEKDVDGANPLSLGRLVSGLPAFAPTTAEAVVRLLDHHHVELTGRRVAVVGRSAVVGKPVAHLLLNQNATVTVCHSRTKDLAEVTSSAEVVVAAVGKAGLITADHVAPGAVVVDVGTIPTESGGMVGDVEAEGVAAKAGALTPVPGGVGPVTTALLLQHTVQAASR